jgi:hypothetical protein
MVRLCSALLADESPLAFSRSYGKLFACVGMLDIALGDSRLPQVARCLRFHKIITWHMFTL